MDWKHLKLLLFGGKGGVGKTTAASAAAIYLAQTKREELSATDETMSSNEVKERINTEKRKREIRENQCKSVASRSVGDSKILVVSTDPAHSLGDSLNCPIGEEITPVEGIDNLWAQELNAARLGHDFKEKYGDVIKKLVHRGTFLDQQDIDQFFSLSLPGMDEVMAIIEIAKLIKDKKFGQIILDTAPTGHTMRLLALPEHMEKWIQVLDLMQAKHRYLARHFAGRYVKDDADRFLKMMMTDVKRVKSLLSNSRSTEFVPVTIPEPMSIYETERLLRTLKNYKIPVKNIIVNRVAQERECKFCASRRSDQEASLREIDETFDSYNLIKIPLFPQQVRGTNDLMEFGKIISVNSRKNGPQICLNLRTQMNADGNRMLDTGRAKLPLSHISENPSHSATRDQRIPRISGLLEKQFLLFGGKGGVGKTCIAAATALRMARRNPTEKVLVFSTDPAHSLSDSFDQEIGDKITPICYREQSFATGGTGIPACHAGQDVRPARLYDFLDEEQRTRNASPVTRYPIETNLFAIEIDAAELFDDLRNEYRESIEEMFGRLLGRNVDMKFDREVMTELVSIAPPGLDEIMALKEITDLHNKREYDFFILDTAPTGHLLRFLEMPDLIREWLKTFFGLLLKYRNVIRLGRLVDSMLELSRSVRKIQAILTDPQKTDFVAITIPEAMAVLEMERLLSQLKKLGIPCSHILINKVIPPTECGFCALKRQEQTSYVEEIRSKFPGYTTAELPLFSHQIEGTDDLARLSEAIYGVDLYIREMERVGSVRPVE